MTTQKSLNLGLLLLLMTLLWSHIITGCAPSQDPAAETKEIILYNWEGDVPQSVLDSFIAEFHINIRYEAYESQEEALENIRAGQPYDVVALESRFIPYAVKEGLLAKLDYENILNFKNVSPNFRDLSYDPGNQYSIPYSWGVTGLVVRTDLIQKPVKRWSDLWDESNASKTAIWIGQPRETIAFTLKSLGYSANSENPRELEAALARLIELKRSLKYVEDFDLESAGPALASGEIFIAMGYSGDYQASLDEGLSVEFVLPEEGALLWGDNFVIPSNSPNKQLAELFINFLLRPEISAEIVNQKYYASANDASRAFIDTAILSNPSIYPDNEVLQNAEIILPLSEEGQRLYDEIWKKFLSAYP